MFEYKESTAIVSIEEPILVEGLSLQRSGLPLSFDSLGALWVRYADTRRGRVENAVMPVCEYGAAQNTIPDYIAGCAVTKAAGGEGTAAFTIPAGRYILDRFNAKTFDELTGSRLEQRDVAGWAKAHGVEIDGRFSSEVYPQRRPEDAGYEMYTLTPVK